MRGVAAVACALALAGPAAASTRVAFLRGSDLVVLDLRTRVERVVLRHAGSGPVRWSGDGRLVSSGGRVAGGPSFPTGELAWTQEGETAAFATTAGTVDLWSPSGGRRTIVPASWGATTLAWGPGGTLVLGRSICPAPCGVPRHQEVWIRRAGAPLRRVAGPLRGVVLPFAEGVAPDGRALWWADPQDSGSIAADGLWLYADRTPLAQTLRYPDYVARCGRRLALAAGGDRYATHGKRILLDGRDVSRDPSRSWVSPACSADGRTLVAAAGRNWEEPRIGSGEHRAIWQLLPARRRLTDPPAGWTDEDPHVLPDGSVLFVRTRQTWRGNVQAVHGTLELLRRGRPTPLADVSFTSAGVANYYGHYDWPVRLAVSP